MATCFMMVAWKVLRFSGFGNLGAGASLPSLICLTMPWTLVMLTFRNLAIADMGMYHLLLALGSYPWYLKSFTKLNVSVGVYFM